MNAFLKKISFAGLAFGGLFLAACGDDGSSSGIDLEDSFDMVLSRAQYDYNSKDSSLIVKKPVCKVGELGNLVWREEAPDAQDTFKVYLDKNTAMMIPKGLTEPQRYGFDGGKFPVGFWSTSDKKADKFQRGVTFKKGGKLNDVIHYSGECYAQDFKSNMFEKNPAIAQTEKALLEFYRKFLPESKKDADQESISKNVRADDCDRLTLFDDLVAIEVDELKEYSGELTVSYEDKECSLDFAFRYAINEEDCNAAYDEFKADKGPGEFKFEDYSMKVEYNEYCIEKLVLQMKEDQGISLKKSASYNTLGKDFAKSIVNLVVSGMK
jgi:hypothetical protein